MISEKIKESIIRVRGKENDAILSVTPLSGGSINDVYKLQMKSGQLFLKLNSASKYPGMFAAEARGLDLLRKSSNLLVPEVIGLGSEDDDAFLLLEYLESSPTSKSFFEELGAGIAKLHRNSSKTFGLDHDNYIGSLPQVNTSMESWTEFFISCRMEPQLKMALDSANVERSILRCFDAMYKVLDEIFPPEPAALLHGDLWSGNYHSTIRGAAIIDPAVYYGHREMDLAMSKLFGGFDSEFYDSYNNEYPLEKRWQQRVEICNLYPLLVHTNLFGGSYGRQLMGIVRRF